MVQKKTEAARRRQDGTHGWIRTSVLPAKRVDGLVIRCLFH